MQAGVTTRTAGTAPVGAPRTARRRHQERLSHAAPRRDRQTDPALVRQAAAIVSETVRTIIHASLQAGDTSRCRLCQGTARQTTRWGVTRREPAAAFLPHPWP